MKLKRIIAVLLCLCLAASWLPAGTAAAETEEPASIEEQIRAFADSIDQSKADDEAARALASHGMFKNGKKLSVGKSHALTATLMNAELTQVGLSIFCEELIRSMQQLDLDQLDKIRGNLTWYGKTGSYYFLRVYDDLDTDWWAWTPAAKTFYGEKRNGYDESLDWMAGITLVEMSIKRSKVTADTATYRVTLEFQDRFDFSTSSNSFFKDLISGIGALLFREFDWVSKVTFDLQVPYTCPHGSRQYRLTYDPEGKSMVSDDSGDWQGGDLTRHTYTDESGAAKYYYELSEPVRLRHDRPWVMEFDTRNISSCAFSPLRSNNNRYPVLHINGKRFIAVTDYELVQVSQTVMDQYDLSSDRQTVRHYYGTNLNEKFSYSSRKTYTLRLENELRADGGNMIYLTVRETETGAVVLERTPMDDYFRYENWTEERILKDEHNEWVSGQDLVFSYIGLKYYPFSADHFELRIFENGEDGEAASDYEKTKYTAPTCTKRGYNTYVCAACGRSRKADYVPAAGHTWGTWEVVREATSTETGLRRHSCTVCDTAEEEEIPMLEYTCGDANGDGSINSLDVVLLRQYLADWDVTVDPRGADANGDGKVNSLDVVLLRQYLAGWDVTLGPKP